jgi:AcrR family transcriptional regulator
VNTLTVKEKILKIATRRFAAVGFEAATMRSIASRAGVTLPTIYHYFGDKENLYLEACLATFAPRADRALEAFTRSAATAEHRIMNFFIDLASDLLEDEEFFKLLHREMIDQDKDGIQKLTDRCWKQSFTALCAAFRSVDTAGRDPAQVTLTSFALMLGLAEFRRNAPFLDGKFTRFYHARILAELVLNTTVPQVEWSGLLARTA